MATVYVSYINFNVTGGDGEHAIVARGDNARSEKITSSGTSATGTMTSEGNQVAIVYCETTVIVTAGVSPTASLATGVVCVGGLATPIGVLDGHKIAVIDDA